MSFAYKPETAAARFNTQRLQILLIAGRAAKLPFLTDVQRQQMRLIGKLASELKEEANSPPQSNGTVLVTA